MFYVKQINILTKIFRSKQTVERLYANITLNSVINLEKFYFYERTKSEIDILVNTPFGSF